MAYTTDANGIPILEPKSLLSDVPAYTSALAPHLVDANGDTLSTVSDQVAEHDTHLDNLDKTLLYVAGHPIYYPGYTSGEEWTSDGGWWHFNSSTHQGCPAESGDVISVSCSWWRGASVQITAARLYVTHAYLPLAHCHGQTWYIPHNFHGTFGTVQANFVVQPNMIQGDRVYLSVSMNNGGVASLDEFTCHGWANHGKALVHSPRDGEEWTGEVNETGLPIIPPV